MSLARVMSYFVNITFFSLAKYKLNIIILNKPAMIHRRVRNGVIVEIKK